MGFKNGSEIADEHVENMVYRDKQVSERGVVLTVSKVEEFTTPAELDFGGGEYTESRRRVLNPVKRSSEDDYGWWSLDRGEYLVTLNESVSLEGGLLGILQPWKRLLNNGVTHNTVFLEEGNRDLKVVLSVGKNGLGMKENARISFLKVLCQDG